MSGPLFGATPKKATEAVRGMHPASGMFDAASEHRRRDVADAACVVGLHDAVVAPSNAIARIPQASQAARRRAGVGACPRRMNPFVDISTSKPCASTEMRIALDARVARHASLRQ